MKKLLGEERRGEGRRGGQRRTMHKGPSGDFGDRSRQTAKGFISIRVQHTPRKNSEKRF